MPASPLLIQRFLLEAERSLTAFAVAFTTPSRDVLHFRCVSGDDDAARRTIELTADTFLMECRSREQPLVRNKVRFEADGPRIGRFIVVPVRDGSDELAGVLLVHRRNEDAEFSTDHVRTAAALGQQLGRL